MTELQRQIQSKSFAHIDLSSRKVLSAVYDAVLESDHDSTLLSSRCRMLLTLLTYCYAQELYSANEIEFAARNDSAVRYICLRNPPNAAELRAFRRDHKASIIQALAQVLTQFSLHPGSLAFNALSESFDRVQKAIQLDSFELDE